MPAGGKSEDFQRELDDKLCKFQTDLPDEIPNHIQFDEIKLSLKNRPKLVEDEDKDL